MTADIGHCQPATPAIFKTTIVTVAALKAAATLRLAKRGAIIGGNGPLRYLEATGFRRIDIDITVGRCCFEHPRELANNTVSGKSPWRNGPGFLLQAYPACRWYRSFKGFLYPFWRLFWKLANC
jgi:hypothetical protein